MGIRSKNAAQPIKWGSICFDSISMRFNGSQQQGKQKRADPNGKVMNHERPKIEAASDPKRIKAKDTRKRKGGKEYPTPRDLAHSVANTGVRQVIKRASCNELKIN